MLDGVCVSESTTNGLPIIGLGVRQSPDADGFSHHVPSMNGVSSQAEIPSLWPSIECAPLHISGPSYDIFLSIAMVPSSASIFGRSRDRDDTQNADDKCHGLHFVCEDGSVPFSLGQWHKEDRSRFVSKGQPQSKFWISNGANFTVRVRATWTADMDSACKWFLVRSGETLHWWTGSWGDFCELKQD